MQLKCTYTKYDLLLAKETDELLVGFSTTEAVAALSDPLTAIILPFTLGVDDCFTFAFGFPAINQGQIKQQMTACGKTQKT